jgi:hypothetical protein
VKTLACGLHAIIIMLLFVQINHPRFILINVLDPSLERDPAADRTRAMMLVLVLVLIDACMWQRMTPTTTTK